MECSRARLDKDIRWETQKEIDEEGFEKPEVDEDFIYEIEKDDQCEKESHQS